MISIDRIISLEGKCVCSDGTIMKICFNSPQDFKIEANPNFLILVEVF